MLVLPCNNIYCVFPVKNLTLTCKISTTRCVVLCFQFHHWDSREMCLETVQTSGALCLLWLYMQCWLCWDNLRLVNNFLPISVSLSNENGKKGIGLDCQTTTLLVHLMKVPPLHLIFLSRTGPQDNNFVFLFLNFDRVLWNSTPKQFANI